MRQDKRREEEPEKWDHAWYQIDKERTNFIFAEDLPRLMKDPIWNPLTAEQWANLEGFATDSPAFKIEKEKLNPIMLTAIGKSLDELLSVSHEENDDHATSKVEMEPRTKTQSENDNNNNDKKIRTKDARPNLISKLSELNKELHRKDEIIMQKQNVINGLIDNVNLYKEKFEFLQREFTFYKQHDTQKRKPQTNENVGVNEKGDRNVNLKHEFILSEFRRQVREQNQLIAKLKERINSNPDDANAYLSSPTPNTVNEIKPAYISMWPPIIAVLLLLLFIIYSLISYTNVSIPSLLSSQEDDSDFARNQLSWWERISWLSRMIWSMKDYLESSSSSGNFPIDREDDAYNRVFGLTD
ncbi:hypothetical protein NCAS_0D03770 [Naumovozyma castellii]|uniref:Monopolar spindle protein 2 n=1 Tax=Naumovozyma castellii TaxID=27288 RepID=G0VEG7_NAUCA|nr:hypothetical protein NCAS_0D03770 [Naumovozyma castellii CBS 4309]CCC69958.1 hypothetical protein NCAS_0D03770 [Naumovozyma castellii CBS 4309]